MANCGGSSSRDRQSVAHSEPEFNTTHQIVYEQLFATVNVRAKEKGVDASAHKASVEIMVTDRVYARDSVLQRSQRYQG